MMNEPCPQCGSSWTRSSHRSRLYFNQHGPVIPPGCLSLALLFSGSVLFAAGEWLLPTFRVYLFVLGALGVLAPIALPFRYLRYRLAYHSRQRCLECGYRWRVLHSTQERGSQ
jgi:hypothetical protein